MKNKRGVMALKKATIVMAIVLGLSVFSFVGCGNNDTTDKNVDETTTMATTATDTVKDDVDDLGDDVKDMVDDTDNATETTK